MNNDKMSSFVGVRLPPKLSQALKEIIKRHQAQAPLFTAPTKSDVIRWLIAEEHKRMNAPANCVQEQRATYSSENC